jgi:hypothetical protein
MHIKFLRNYQQNFKSKFFDRSFFTSTTSLNRKLNSNKMFESVIRVRLDEKDKRAALSLKCKIFDDYEREINLNRDYDEDLLSTFQKLYSSFLKHYNARTQKANKKIKIEENNIDKLSDVSLELPLSLHDLDDKIVPLNTKNKDAWKENFTFRLKDQKYSVCVNLPSMKKIALPKLIIAGFPTHAKIDVDSDHLDETIIQNSLFSWYSSRLTFNPEEFDASKSAKKNKNKNLPVISSLEWDLIEQGVGKKYCLINESLANKFIRIECQPSDGKRKGLAIENYSNSLIMPTLDKGSMAMTINHKMTQNRLNSDK